MHKVRQHFYRTLNLPTVIVLHGVLNKLVVSKLLCQLRGWGSNPPQDRNMFCNFCSDCAYRKLNHNEYSDCKLPSGKIRHMSWLRK